MNLRLFDGAVLAGGRSSRMGRDKIILKVAGETLLLRQLRLLSEVGADPRWVSISPESPVPEEVPSGVEVVRDHASGAGPMAGLARVFESIRHPWVLVVAVDLPVLDVPFLQQLIARSSPGRGVIPEWRQQLEPLAALYPHSAGASLSDSLQRGDFGLQRWARQGIADGWLAAWQLDPGDAGRLLNWNCPDDFAES